MKVVILAGGYGTRISEESQFKPKPMIEIGGMPILWHIMKTYSHYGFNDFVICAGYKQSYIKEWFSNYFLHTSDVTFDFSTGENLVTFHNRQTEPWKVTCASAGAPSASAVSSASAQVRSLPFFILIASPYKSIPVSTPYAR